MTLPICTTARRRAPPYLPDEEKYAATDRITFCSANRESGGDEPGERRKRPDLADQREHDGDRHRSRDHDRRTRSDTACGAGRGRSGRLGAAPQLRAAQEQPDQRHEQRGAHGQAAQDRRIFAVARGVPLREVRPDASSSTTLLPERKQRARDFLNSAVS